MKIYVVDENDEVIELKERSEIRSEDIYRVSGLWITNSKDEVLLAQRSFDRKHDPGKWGPGVAGTVEAGESYVQNMIKEVEEELGLKDIKIEIGPKYRNQGEHNYFVQWFIAEIDKNADELEIQEEEVEKLRWISKSDLLNEFKNQPENFIGSAKNWIELFCK